MQPGKTGIARIVNAFGYSVKGLAFTYKNEAAFRQELWASVALVPMAFYLASSGTELVMLISPIFLVLIVELINSALEAVVDRIGAEKHELSGAAKDIGSAAVLLSIGLLMLIWAVFLFERFGA